MFIYWFRNDLRLNDNAALIAAAAQANAAKTRILAVCSQPAGGIKTAADWWQVKSIAALGLQLKKRGSLLVVIDDLAANALPALASSVGATQIFWTAATTPDQQREDDSLISALKNVGGAATPVRGNSLLHNPDKLAKPDGAPYKIFTPFYKKWLDDAAPSFVRPLPAPSDDCFIKRVEIDDRLSVPRAQQPEWTKPLDRFWSTDTDGGPGEAGAHSRLLEFVDNKLHGYNSNRDMLDKGGTSLLSPALHWGDISPRQVINATLIADEDKGTSEPYIRQLAWREFAAYTLHHNPAMTHRSLKAQFDNGMWQNGPQTDRVFGAWCQGKTGQSLVDAAMQELRQTGQMHNRARMIVASYLTKNLGLDWRRGAAWFMQTLVDADPANNAFGWQWVAGCGLDAAPYFRIFNPETQAKKFDPHGLYRAKWLGPQWQHRDIAPLVDLGESRKQALARYRAARYS